MRALLICAVLVLCAMGAKTSPPLSLGYAFSAHESWPVIVRLQANGGGVPFATVADFGADAATPAGTNSISVTVPNAQDQIAWTLTWSEIRTGRAYEARFAQNTADLPNADGGSLELVFEIGRHGALTQYSLSQQRHDQNAGGVLQSTPGGAYTRADYPIQAQLCATRTSQAATPIDITNPGPDIFIDVARMQANLKQPAPDTPCPDPGR